VSGARQYGCAVCRRPLNRFRDGSGVVGYQHALNLAAHDHEPVPCPADRIAGGVIHCCDFCSTEDGNAWLFETAADITLVATGPGTRLTNNYGTRWAACPACADLVSTRNLDQVHARALDTAGLPRNDPASATARQMMATTLAALEPGRTLLLDGRTGTAPTLPPATLPKVRDRLSDLLDPDNALPELTDPTARRQIAAGLPMSRLYTVDTAYTDMAIAAASGLRGATIGALDVPAPYGLLTWAHPVDDRTTIAASWATDGRSIHVAMYRTLATTITGVQLQKVREQAGWLVPTGTTTLHPDHGVYGDHPAAVLLATWLLIAHRLTESIPVAVDPPIRKAYARSGRPTPEVQLVRLGPHPQRGAGTLAAAHGAQAHARRQPDHRWWVKPFVRNQPHGPRGTLRKPVLVFPFVNGPAGKPIRASTTVRILAQPTAREPGGKP
jgi:hypothetical protein